MAQEPRLSAEAQRPQTARRHQAAPRNHDESYDDERFDEAAASEAGPATDEGVDKVERMNAFLDSMQDDILPDLPNIPGYHVCWLTTTNARDPVARRLRAGYELLRASDFPGMEGISLKTGDYNGVIGINEMVAAKIPISAWKHAMRTFHHDRPNQEEAKLRSNVEAVKENAARQGFRIVEEGDGTAGLGSRAPEPTFQP